VGKWRTKEAGMKIDASAKLPDGTVFEGPAGLKKVLMARGDDFAATAVSKLLVYSLGRGLEHYDVPTVRAITRETVKDNYRMSSLITAIVKSTPFQMRRTPDQ